jgi:hypothetical protein
MEKPFNQLSKFARRAVISDYAPKVAQFVASIGEEVFELVVSLLVMILVEQVYGSQDLGIYFRPDFLLQRLLCPGTAV